VRSPTKARPGFAIAGFLFAMLASGSQPLLRALKASVMLTGIVTGVFLGLSALMPGLGIRSLRRRMQ